MNERKLEIGAALAVIALLVMAYLTPPDTDPGKPNLTQEIESSDR